MLLPAPQEELMATTRTPGITVLADGRRFIDKRRLGVRIGLRVGAITQEQAEERLRVEMALDRSTSGNAMHTHIRPSPTAPRATWPNRVASAASMR